LVFFVKKEKNRRELLSNDSEKEKMKVLFIELNIF